MGAFDGKVAFITGGGTGIGRATAERIAAGGGKVVVAGRREAPLREVASTAPDRIDWVQLDIGDWAAQDRALATVLDRYGRLDILVNDAATQTTKLFADHDEEEIVRNVHVNLTSTMLLTHKALPHLIAAKGTVIFVTSAAARYSGMPPARLSAYSASKAGLNQLTRVLATELGPRGVRVNAVSPGLTETEIAASAFTNQALVDYLVSITPLSRVGQPEDIAKVICFLASEEAGWVTGQVVDATGGYWLAS